LFRVSSRTSDGSGFRQSLDRIHFRGFESISSWPIRSIRFEIAPMALKAVWVKIETANGVIHSILIQRAFP
jgi:hypothetical protein